MPKKKIIALNEEFDLKLFLTIVKKKSYWILILLFIAFSFAFIYLRYTPPLYESASTIKLGLVNNASAIISASAANPLFDPSQFDIASFLICVGRGAAAYDNIGFTIAPEPGVGLLMGALSTIVRIRRR